MASTTHTVAALTSTVTTHSGVAGTETAGTHLTDGTLPTAGATSHTAAGTMAGTTVITGITGDGEITTTAQLPHLTPSLNQGLQQLLEL